MELGELLAGRFLLLERAGAGGMGEVFKASDYVTKQFVAVKLLLSSGGDLHRFEREARVLAALKHPSIVRYIAHGQEHGTPWIAMEWLEGRELADRIEYEGLSLLETLLVIEQLAGALEVAHAQGVVHRDIKPSNVLLLGNQCSNLRLLDFGVARFQNRATRLATATGVMLGTPGYMAPEQARGERGIDHRADLFSLGCVFFECLTGRPAFQADNLLALLARILLDEPPRLRSLRPQAPAALEELVAHLLEKDPERRLSSAAALKERLVALRSSVEELTAVPGASTRKVPPTPALSVGEQRVLCVVLATDRRAQSYQADATFSGNDAVTVQAPIAPMVQVLERLRAHPLIAGVRIEKLRDESLVCALDGATTDQAQRAARVALLLHQLLPEHRVVVATGQGTLSAHAPMGTVLERAIEHASPMRDDSSGVLLDETTAALLTGQFILRFTPEGTELLAERQEDDEQLLFGQRTPFVGRERELAIVQSTVAEVCDESVARAVLLTGPAGIGKSRLRSELLAVLQTRDPQPYLWRVRCDPLLADATYSVISVLLRSALLWDTSDRGALAREKLRARVPGSNPRTVVFLGELLNVPFPDGEDAALATARKDPSLMAESVRDAVVSYLSGVCKERPVVLSIEDAHNADGASLRLLDSVLRLLAAEPLLLLAFGRPTLLERFPHLWAERNATELRLAPLGKKACERIVQKVLGAQTSVEQQKALVERCAGNPYYLEELLRAVSAGMTALPETILAMVQARLSTLETETRRVLRACAVFGLSFCFDGVLALLGGIEADFLREQLEELCHQEFVAEQAAGATGGKQFRFLHDLVREGAYAMLTEQDRVLGHKLAAQWLSEAGNTEPMILAEHWERGGEPLRAVECLWNEIERSLRACDVTGAAALVDRVERLLQSAGGASRAQQATLARMRSEGLMLGQDVRRGLAFAREAMELSTKGSEDWSRAAVQVAIVGARAGALPLLVELDQALAERGGEAQSYLDFARSILARQWYIADQIERGDALIAALEHSVSWYEEHELRTAGLLHGAFVHRNRGRAHVWKRLDHAERSLALARTANDKLLEAYAVSTLVTVLADLGHWEDCSALVEKELFGRADRKEFTALRAAGLIVRGRIHHARGEDVEAIKQLTTALELFRAAGDPRRVVYIQTFLAEVLLQTDPQGMAPAIFALDESELASVAMIAPLYWLHRGHYQLVQGALDEALHAAERAEHSFVRDFLLQVEFGAPLLRAKVLKALGRTEESDALRRALAVRASERMQELPERWRKKTEEGVREVREALGYAATAVRSR